MFWVFCRSPPASGRRWLVCLGSRSRITPPTWTANAVVYLLSGWLMPDRDDPRSVIGEMVADSSTWMSGSVRSMFRFLTRPMPADDPAAG